MSAVAKFGLIALAAMLGAGGSYWLATAPRIAAAPNPASAKAPADAPAVPADAKETHNPAYGFSFHYPRQWGTGPFNDRNVRESVGRPDGVFCYVSVMEHNLAADETGTPLYLRAQMRSLSMRNLEGHMRGAKVKAERLETSTLGGQEARSFVLYVAGTRERDFKVSGRVTLRDYGIVFLGCVAPADRFNDSDLQESFRLVHTSFRFDGRARPESDRPQSSSASPTSSGGLGSVPNAVR